MGFPPVPAVVSVTGLSLVVKCIPSRTAFSPEPRPAIAPVKLNWWMKFGGVLTTASMIDTSICWPSPVSRCWKSAAMVAMELDPFIAGWLAPLIVGVIVSVVGWAILVAGKKKMEPSNLRPERTQRSLRETGAWAERKV